MLYSLHIQPTPEINNDTLGVAVMDAAYTGWMQAVAYIWCLGN